MKYALLLTLLLCGCDSTEAPVRYGALGAAAAVTPVSTWSTPHWYIDPQNTSGCASPNRTGTSRTCSGTAGPLLNFSNLVDKWGCTGNPRACPQLPQTTVVTYMSRGPTDNVVLFPECLLGGSLRIEADLPTPAFTGNFNLVTQWSGSCARGRVEAVSNIGVPGAFLVDTTIGASPRGWCNEISATVQCDWTIPMAAATVPPSTFQTPGLYTSATGGAGTIGSTDAFAEYTSMLDVDLVDLEPVVGAFGTTDAGAANDSCVYLYHLNASDPQSSIADAGDAGLIPQVGKNMLTLGPGVTGYEMSSDRVLNLVGDPSIRDEGCVNCRINGGIVGGRLSTGHYWHLLGGMVTRNATNFNVTGTGLALDGWVSIWPTGSFLQGVSIGLLFANNLSGALNCGGTSVFAALSPGYGTVQNGQQICSQASAVNVLANGSFRYDSSHGGTAGVFFNSTPFTLNGQSTACSLTLANPAVETCGISVSTTTIDGVVDSSHFGGRVYGAFGSSIMANTQ